MPAGRASKPGVAQQRIEPDEPRARLGEPLRLEREALAGVGVEAVADQQHDGILPEQPPRPVAVELGEALADARAARPVLDRAGDARERDVDVAMAQVRA